MRVPIMILALILLLSGHCEAQRVTVNWSKPQQTIDGFGGAAVTFTSPLPNNLADFFFDRSTGIGLSILRVQVIPDTKTCNSLCMAFPSEGCGCIASSGATILTGELQTIRQAQARGVRTFFATSWSPPGYMKRNKSWLSGGTFNGGTNNYKALASIFTSYVTLLKSEGVPLYAFSPQNEPNLSMGYQSSVWTPQQFHDFIPYLTSDFKAAGFGSVKIMFPENSAWSNNYAGLAGKTMKDSAVARNVGIMAQHGYAGDVKIVPAPNYGMHLWVTEDSASSPVYDGSMADALKWAEIIHRYLAVANVNAFVWWFLTNIPANGEGKDNSALTDANGNIPLRAYVTGNWSKFVRPGWRRVSVAYNGSLLITAFANPSGTGAAIVVVNSGSTVNDQNFSVGAEMGATVVPWVTSAKQSLQKQPALRIASGSFTYTIPASSVVTFAARENGSISPAKLRLRARPSPAQ